MKVFILTFFLFQSFAYARVISVSRTSNLVIGKVVQGDSARIIPCGTSENATNASFTVSGDANRAYTITLPTTASLKLTGATNLTLSNFTSYPVEGPNGLLDSTGKQKVYIGATLAPIPLTQKPGNYSGTFTINVVY